jgi:hypothetical protein
LPSGISCSVKTWGIAKIPSGRRSGGTTQAPTFGVNEALGARHSARVARSRLDPRHPVNRTTPFQGVPPPGRDECSRSERSTLRAKKAVRAAHESRHRTAPPGKLRCDVISPVGYAVGASSGSPLPNPPRRGEGTGIILTALLAGRACQRAALLDKQAVAHGLSLRSLTPRGSASSSLCGFIL